MIDDAVLAQILEDADRLDAGAWSAVLAELRRDASARAGLRALLRQDELLAQAVGRVRPAVQRGEPPPSRARRPPSPPRARRPSPPRARSHPARWALALAAVLAIAVLTCLQLPAQPQAHAQPPAIAAARGVRLIQAGAEREVVVGERLAAGVPATVRWADGTTVALSASAVARVESAARLRLEAGFCRAEVVPRAAPAFSVATEEAEVTVLGTAFTVLRSGTATEVVVAHGLVRVQGSAGGQVELGPAATTRIHAGRPPEPPRHRWPAFVPADIVAHRGDLLTTNAVSATGPDGPELASVYQYRESGTTGVRLMPANPVRMAPGLRLHLRYRSLRPITSVVVQCRNATQVQNFQGPLPVPPADGSWCQASIDLAALTPILRQTPWQDGEELGNVLLSPEQPQSTEDILRLGDFAFSVPPEP